MLIIFISFSFISVVMRKVLAVASVGVQHKQLVLKDLKNIFKRIKISLDVLLQEENTQLDGEQNNKFEPLLKSYPYITLTIPNYEQHRDYLEKVYKNNVLFSKFILLISKGDTYEELISNRSEEILRQHARSWANTVSCSFDSSPVFTDLEQKVKKIDSLLGDMDIRGKISEIDAKKKFHLIEDHWHDVDDPQQVKDPQVPNKKGLFKIFFGLELSVCGGRNRRAGAGGIIIAADSRYCISEQFLEYEEETTQETASESMQMENMSNKLLVPVCKPFQGGCSNLLSKDQKISTRRQVKRRSEQVLANEFKNNPYKKKQYAHEVILSECTMVQQ